MNTNTPELTDDEILQVFADAVGNQEDGARFIDVDRDQALCIARTLLSKLRQGGEPVPKCARCGRFGHTGAGCDGRSSHPGPLYAAPQASGPVADTLPLEKALHELVDKIVPGLDTGDLVQDARQASTALSAILASAPVAGEACAWFTEDHLTDKSATTWDRTVAERWRAKGWPVQSLYAAPQASADARNQWMEEAAAAIEAHQREGRQWVPGSLWDTLSREAAARIRALKSTPAPQPAQPCATCGGTGIVDDGEITGSGGVEYECGPVKCVKDCPDCDTGPRKLRGARAAALADRQQRAALASKEKNDAK